METVLDFMRSQENMLFVIIIHCVMALGMYINLKVGNLTLANAGFIAIGAYTAALLTKRAGIPYPVTLVPAAILPTLLAFAIGRPILRLKGVYLAIATVAMAELIRLAVMSAEFTGGPLGISGLKREVRFWHLFLFFGLVVGAAYLLERSLYDRTFRAITRDESATRCLGINTVRFKVLAFVLGAAVSGLCGAMVAHYTYLVTPNTFGFSLSIEMLMYVILGGYHTLWGPLTGAFILTVLPEALRFSHAYRLLLYGVILLLTIQFLPHGIWYHIEKRLKPETRQSGSAA